jgi:hypothetical protein
MRINAFPELSRSAGPPGCGPARGQARCVESGRVHNRQRRTFFGVDGYVPSFDLYTNIVLAVYRARACADCEQPMEGGKEFEAPKPSQRGVTP